jgi:predicted DNA-binding helix-hairpin-helix protein
MGTLGGVSFGERGRGGQRFQRFGRRANFSVTEIPGGSTTIIQSAGRAADRLNLAIKVPDEGTLNALKAKVDTVTTLIYSGGTRSVYVAAIPEDSIEEVVSPTQTVFFATLELIGR